MRIRILGGPTTLGGARTLGGPRTLAGLRTLRRPRTLGGPKTRIILPVKYSVWSKCSKILYFV